jgi:hypothetical protein
LSSSERRRKLNQIGCSNQPQFYNCNGIDSSKMACKDRILFAISKKMRLKSNKRNVFFFFKISV